jgi:hypothetical protein
MNIDVDDCGNQPRRKMPGGIEGHLVIPAIKRERPSRCSFLNRWQILRDIGVTDGFAGKEISGLTLCFRMITNTNQKPKGVNCVP